MVADGAVSELLWDPGRVTVWAQHWNFMGKRTHVAVKRSVCLHGFWFHFHAAAACCVEGNNDPLRRTARSGRGTPRGSILTILPDHMMKNSNVPFLKKPPADPKMLRLMGISKRDRISPRRLLIGCP